MCLATTTCANSSTPEFLGVQLNSALLVMKGLKSEFTVILCFMCQSVFLVHHFQGKKKIKLSY